ncbi:calcium-dependent secretion activator 1 isoform X1 [Tachysurus ichikawai]
MTEEGLMGDGCLAHIHIHSSIIQVSQYTFAMCSYREKKAEPVELLQLDGYTVDYTDPQPGLDGGRTFFNAVKEGDTVIFASDDEQDRILWVQAMYRATGQSHKPIPPTQVQKLNAKGGTAPQLDAPISQFSCCFSSSSSIPPHFLLSPVHHGIP